jgi:hypothetical protein
MPLTATKLRTIKPTNKTQKLFDGKVMYLEVSPKGGTWWRLKYRIDGREKRISLGVYPDVSLTGNNLSMHPNAGVLIKGTGGIRKLRWARSGRGKSGGVNGNEKSIQRN